MTKSKLLIVFILSFCIQVAHAWSPFGPSNFEECMTKAAKESRSEQALSILIEQCDTEFPGRKSATGGYEYYDPESKLTIPVSGPKLNSADKAKISEYRRQKNLEQENQNRKNMQALSGVKIEKWRVSCSSSYYCGKKNITATIRNASSLTITKIWVGIVIDRKIETCGQLPITSYAFIIIPPGRSATVSFESSAGPSDGRYEACFDVNSVEAY